MNIEGQGYFLTLDQGHLHMKIKTGFSEKRVFNFEIHFICTLLGTRKLKFNDRMLVT